MRLDDRLLRGRRTYDLRFLRSGFSGDGTCDQFVFAFTRLDRLHGFDLERVAVDFGFRFVRGIGNHQQDRGQQIIRDQRRSAGGHIGKGQTGKWNDERDASDNGEHLEGHGEHQTGCEKLAEPILDLHRGDHSGRDDQQIHHENGQQAGESQFLTQGRIDVVGVGDRGKRRIPLPKARAHQTAGSQSENTGDELIRTAILLVVLFRCERMQPGIDSRPHMAEQVGCRKRADGEREKSDDYPTRTSGRHIQHGHEHGEEHQRRTKIMLHDQNAHGDDPHHDDRSHVLNTRQLQAQDLLASDRELVAMVEQVGCEEERKEQLGEFAGLELSKTRNLHPNTRSVLFGAQHWQHRGKQQYQADHHTDVRESPQQTVILHENRQHIRQHQRNGQPYQLSERHGSVRRLIKPGNHHHTDAG